MRYCFAVNMRASAKQPSARITTPRDSEASRDARTQETPEPSLSRAGHATTSDRLIVRYIDLGRTHYLADRDPAASRPVCHCTSLASRNIADLNRACITLVT